MAPKVPGDIITPAGDILLSGSNNILCWGQVIVTPEQAWSAAVYGWRQVRVNDQLTVVIERTALERADAFQRPTG